MTTTTTTTTTVTPEVATIIRAQINDLRTLGWSWNRIAQHLNATNVPTIQGGARWYHTTVQWAVGGTARQVRGERQVRRSRRRIGGYLPHARTFGVEVEWDGGRVNYGNLAAAISTNGVAAHVDGYTHAIPSSWRVMGDGSCDGEVVSPILTGQQGLNDLRTVMQTMKAQGCGARQRASVHVHVSVLDFTADDMARLIRNMRRTEKALLAYVAESRLQNYWARPMNSLEWSTLEQRADNGRLLPRNGESGSVASRHQYRNNGSGVERYRHWNLNPVLVYGTVEFRAHGATLNAAKIKPWIAVTSALVEATRQGVEFATEATVAELLNTLVMAGTLSQAAATQFRAGVAARNAASSATRSNMLGHLVAA